MSAAKVVNIDEARRERASKRSDGEGRITPRGKSWRFEVCINGERHSTSRKKAEFQSMKQRNDAFAEWRMGLRNKAIAGDITTVGELLLKFIALQYVENKAGASIVEKVVHRHLMPVFKDMDAHNKDLLTKVEKYRDKRRTERTKRGAFYRNASINNEVSYLRSSLKLLRPEPRVLLIEKLDTSDGRRTGLISVEMYDALMADLEEYQRPVWCFSYYTATRQGELLKIRREWAKTALLTGILEVPGWHGVGGARLRITKNGDPHCIPLYTEEMVRYLKIALESGDTKCPFLFQREGKRISKHTFYQAYVRTRDRLKMGRILFHDLRRTAVTSMVQNGLSEQEAMDVAGILDPSIFKRYNITTTERKRKNVKKAGEKMAAWHQERKSPDMHYANITPTENLIVEIATVGIANKPN